MLRFIIGIFIILHSLVHLLYFGQSQRIFELQSGLAWPDGSWAFARLFGDETNRLLASISLAVIATAFGATAIGLFLKQEWWNSLLVFTSISSVVIYLLFWDGKLQGLDQKGGVGILINLVILTALLIFRWPKLGF